MAPRGTESKRLPFLKVRNDSERKWPDLSVSGESVLCGPLGAGTAGRAVLCGEA